MSRSHSPSQSFRLDVPLHSLLRSPPNGRINVPRAPDQERLPEPVFPQRPELLGDATAIPFAPPAHRRWSRRHIARAMRGWAVPWIRSRLLPGDFHPIIAYLFTEWKCNLDCHYCWAFENSVKGMTEAVAKRSIDWLRESGAGVLALMGGEPLLRPQFAHRVCYYAAKKGFWIYVPTNARLLRPQVVDWLADAGVATFNFAVDAVDERPGLPKALNRVRSYFDYLVRKQYSYGYSVFFNINICRNNLDDVRQLTDIAHDYGIATDYHINESPMMEQPHFKHAAGNVTFIEREDWDKVDELVEWLIAKKRAGYKMVNSASRLDEMRLFMRGKVQEWNCRAGWNSLIVRTDGTLAPCFPMYGATWNWGAVGNHRFESGQLKEMKKSCQPHCFSTLNHILAYCYNDARVIHWMLRQTLRGFQGVTNFD
jgi:MoaA/NifB/PqqE/SkfB family radical SAM enzyme